ncbi:hypothetical protein [uncultured Thiodictyon sp.]|uniref:hypothetical protein n=1 Tax=uncultured Thiodictyon sp. TaxID=1846217 RepID=UPI0025D63711|nr:hypothetical protein [uncultured Thiodictyon sp.]
MSTKSYTNEKNLRELLKALPPSQSPLIFSSSQIRYAWADGLPDDPLNNRPDITTPDEYIAEARAGRVTFGGIPVAIVDRLPPVS